MRIMLVAAGFIVALALAPGPASAREARWCAVYSMGRGSVHYDCQYNSIEECRPNVISGNRGACGLNPRWEGWNAPAAAPKARKKRHARRH